MKRNSIHYVVVLFLICCCFPLGVYAQSSGTASRLVPAMVIAPELPAQRLAAVEQ